MKIIRSLFISLIVICFAGEVLAMSIFSKNVMFSEVIGTVTLNGVPVEGADVERFYNWSWDDKAEITTTVTDKNGVFKFSQVNKSGGMSNLLPHEPVIFQEITIKYNGKEYVAWQHSKHNYDNNGELKGKRLLMRCELSNSPKNDGVFFGICTIDE